MRVRIAILAAMLAVAAAAPAAAQTNASGDQALQLYVAVATGKRTWQSLTKDEQREVMAVAASMKAAPRRYTSRKCEDLADAQDQLVNASEELRQCAASGGDDCSTEALNVQSVYSDYEDAYDTAEDDCQ